MQVPILIDHLSVVPGHPLQGCEHSLLHFSRTVALLMGFLDLAAPISIGDGILLCSFLEQVEAQPSTFGPTEFLTCPVTLPLQGTIPSAVPIGSGRTSWMP